MISVLLALLALAVVTTAATLWAGTRPELVGVGEEALAGVGILPWAAVALGATNIERVTQCCRTVHAEPLLMYGAGVFVIGHIVLLLFGVTSLLDVRDKGVNAPQNR